MDNDQITALAREYAEERASMMQGSLTTKIQAELVIRFLLRRFCLIKKSEVKLLRQCFGSEEVYEVIDMLFPEIEKEVEL